MFNKERIIELVAVTTTYDSIGQAVKTETTNEVIAKIRSVSMSEWTSANQLGLSAQYEVIIWAHEYNGEEYVNMDSVRYHVYRTYETGDSFELYLEQMVGHESEYGEFIRSNSNRIRKLYRRS